MVPSAMSDNVGGHGSVEGEATMSVGGRVSDLEAPVVGRDLDGVSGGTATFTGSLGRPVRGSNGIVGYMNDFEAGTRKVGDLTFVFSCYVILVIVGICKSIFWCVALSSVSLYHRNSNRHNRRVRRKAESGEDLLET